MKRLKNMHILVIFFLLIFIQPTIYALDTFPINDTFSNSDANGYSRDDGDSNELRINKDRTSQKVYDFGTSYLNKNVTVTFDVRWEGTWESSGTWRDYFYVWFNSDTKVINDSFGGSGSTSYSLDTTTDADGQLRIKFKPNTTASAEKINIDNVTIQTDDNTDIDLSITSISDTPDPIAVDNNITYSINILNTSNTATNVELNISLAYNTLQTTNPTGWSCYDMGSTRCVKADNIASGDNQTLNLTFLSPSTPQILDANFSIGSDNNDSNISNNTFNTTTQVIESVGNADDLCYEDIESSGMMCFNMGICSGGMGCKNTIPLKNIGDATLSDVNILYDESGGMGGSYGGECGVDPAGTCSTDTNSFMGGTVSRFKITNNIAVGDDSNSIWAKEFMSGQCFGQETLWATYIKANKYYRGQISKCQTVQPSDFTCAYPKEFTEIFNQNIYGKMILIGNTSLCENDGHGVCSDPGTARNNNINMMHNDFDNDPITTTNSSASLLDIPADKNILFAGLFWQGYLVGTNDSQKELGKTIKYKYEGDTYHTETNASMNWVYFDANRFYYQGYLELTEYVKQHGDGYYWVGDIATTEGQPQGGSFGAWSMIVVYEDDDEEFKNITLFHGYQAFAGDADINNAISYANTNGCSTNNTGVGNGVTSTLSGFLTPKENDVNSTLAVFAGEGDIGISGDSGSITDKNGVEHPLFNALNPQSNIMNATISRYNLSITSGKPYISANSLGIDIDMFDVSGILDNKQTSTDIKFTTSGDGYMPGMYGLETELYIPDFCYDYSYKQNGIYFTELNDGTKNPTLKGSVSTTHPIEMGIYIKNRVDSDVEVNNFYLNVYDINSSQTTYARDSVQLTPPNSILAEDVDDILLDVSDTYVKNIPVGSLSSNDYFYFYYNLDVNSSVSEVDDPINIKAYYDLTIGNENISYELQLGKKIGMCTDNNFRYQPAKSIFNLIHNDYYDLDIGGTTHYYNLPTQVVNRAGDFKIIALEPDNLDTLHNVSTIVAVEMIDLSSFHDTNASCQQLSSAVSDRVWVVFNDEQSKSFDKTALTSAINNGLTSIASPSEFYKTARQNATFRITFNVTNDGNESLVQTELQNSGNYKILNFTELVQSIGVCSQDMDNNTNNTDTVATYCGNAGNTGITAGELATCMECLYGYRTKFICSRDNFAVRPEAFDIVLKDANQTLLKNGTTDISAGYTYQIEANATTHTNSSASYGYSHTLDETNGDEVGLVWSPRSIDASGCNDNSNDTLQRVDFSHGYLSDDISINQVGEYSLKLLDKTWTSVDSNPSYMLHHSGSYFKVATTLDCLANSNIVNSDNPYSHTLNGCEISSTHTNSYLPKDYVDYNITTHPYKFGFDSTTFSVGKTNTPIASSSYAYMANLYDDENISLHIDTKIKALSYDGSTLSNFVDGCFAKPITLSINKSTIQNGSTYQYKFHNTDNIGTNTNVVDMNNTSTDINLTTNDFKKSNVGVINTKLNLNFKRDVDKALNPQTINFITYDANCTSTSECSMFVDSTTKSTSGSYVLDKNITHYFGRTHSSRQTFVGNTGSSNIYFEVYCNGSDCNKTLLQNQISPNLKHTNDARWFINENHSVTNDGTIGVVTQKYGKGITITSQDANPSTANFSYNKNYDYPYKTTIQNSASSWLIYNPDDASATKNSFQVEFIEIGEWTGKKETNTTTKNIGSAKINRRTIW